MKSFDEARIDVDCCYDADVVSVTVSETRRGVK